MTAAMFAPVTTKAQTANAPVAVQEPRMPVTNRITLSARFGFGISAKFSGAGSASAIAIPLSARTTPNGDAYNYDDGYVLPDVSGSGDGLTWYLGYDDNSSQVNAGGNTILLSRNTGTATLSSPDTSDTGLGAEITYTRQWRTNEHFKFGFEAAGNFINTSIRAVNPYSLQGTRITDAFAYFAGTTPPTATPGSPYLATFNGPGFVMGTNIVSSITTVGSVGTVTGSRNLEADLWGARLGPYLEYYLDDEETFSLGVSGGLAIGYLTTDVSWNETIAFNGGGSITDTGSGSDSSFRLGFYIAANAYWRMDENWGLAGSLQYQNLGTYSKVFGTRKVELDLSKSIFVTVGISYSF